MLIGNGGNLIGEFFIQGFGPQLGLGGQIWVWAFS